MKYLPFLIILPILLCYCSKSYRVNIISVNSCPNLHYLQLPFIKPVPYKLNIELNTIKGHSIIRGNLSVEKDIPGFDKEITILTGKKTTNGIKWLYSLKNLKCTNVMVKNAFEIVGVPITGCKLKKGTYFVKDVDVDAIDSAFTTMSRLFGEYVCKISIYSKNNTFACMQSQFKISPVKINKV